MNVDRESLGRTVLEPWVAGMPFAFAAGEWQPRHSRLTVLDGPAIESEDTDDAWDSALRAAEDVTRAVLEDAEANAPDRIALLVAADSIEGALDAAREGHRLRRVSWSAAVERINARDPEVLAMIVVVKGTSSAWPPFLRERGSGRD